MPAFLRWCVFFIADPDEQDLAAKVFEGIRVFFVQNLISQAFGDSVADVTEDLCAEKDLFYSQPFCPHSVICSVSNRIYHVSPVISIFCKPKEAE